MRDWSAPGFTELRSLGSGGFGDVVMARHDGSGTLVAIKYLHRALLDDPDFAGMFRAEARVLASLNDTNVVRLYEYIESPSGAAIVMELVDGVSLREILSRYGKTRAEAALVVLRGSLLGLAAAHARGVVHRDYKPANVLVNGAGLSKLTDFGIAARAGDRPVPAGTLAYAPPEQFEGTPASPAGDVYAATVTFYECLTGQVPFAGSTDTELYDKHRLAAVPLDPIPEPLRPVVARGLAKSPVYRPSDAGRLAAELQAAAATAYGRDWAERGRSHLGEAAALLAALWPSGLASAGPGHPAGPSHTVDQAHLSRNSQVTQPAQHQGQVAHGHDLHAGHVEHAEHVEHLQHVQHAQHVEHAEHLAHLQHLGYEQVAHGAAGPGAAGPGAAGRTAAQARRGLRVARRAAAHHPAAAIATAVVGAAAVAGVVVATGGSGGSPLSINGAWSNSGSTFTFTPSGGNSYTVSLVTHSNTKCAQPDDGAVTGTNGHFSGTINLWEENFAGSAGQCPPKTGVAQITIDIAANGATLNVYTVGDDCPTCGHETWTRGS